MSEPTLTDTERETLGDPNWAYGPHIPAAIERIVAARTVDAVDRERGKHLTPDEMALLIHDAVMTERAAWATKIEALADKWERDAGPDSEAWRVYGPQTASIPFAVATLRALLAADDTEAKP